MEQPQVTHRTFFSYLVKGDSRIWGIYVALLVISIVEIFSATSQLTYGASSVSAPAVNHMRNLLIGFIILLAAQGLNLKAIMAWDKLIYLGGLGFMAYAVFFTKGQNDASRSAGFFQPVEALKVGTIMLLCSAITVRDSVLQVIPWFRTRTRSRRFWLLLGIVALPSAIIITQNLSSVIIIVLASLGVMFLARLNAKYMWRTMWAILGLSFLGAVFLYGVYCDNVRIGQVNPQHEASVVISEKPTLWEKFTSRPRTWANRVYDSPAEPLWERDINGKYKQPIHAHMAIANSYPLGRFVGNSQIRDYLPQASTDYIFSIIFEEWGVFGALVVLIIYLTLLWRCYRLSRLTQNEYIRLMLVGLPLILVIQALMHIGVNTGAMFVTGQPLPLISRGGSNIVFTSFSLGIILALTRMVQHEQQQAEMETSHLAPVVALNGNPIEAFNDDTADDIPEGGDDAPYEAGRNGASMSLGSLNIAADPDAQ